MAGHIKSTCQSVTLEHLRNSKIQRMPVIPACCQHQFAPHLNALGCPARQVAWNTTNATLGDGDTDGFHSENFLPSLQSNTFQQKFLPPPLGAATCPVRRTGESQRPQKLLSEAPSLHRFAPLPSIRIPDHGLAISL